MTVTAPALPPAPPAPSLPRSLPERQGIGSAAILGFLDAVERDVHDLHSFMLLRHGAVVAEGWWEPYGPRSPHQLFSLSKSFTSTAVGLLVAEGKLSVDDLVLGFFPGEAPAQPGEHLRALRVRHLLTMTAGHDEDPTRAVFRQQEVAWTRAFLAQPLAHAPGTHFVYNTAATYMLSAIVQRVTGERLLHYLRPRLFEPLGIDGPEHPTWETSPQGVDVGGSGLSLTTEDIARFGQLYLQKGVWQGQRLLPETWIEAATARQVPNGPSQNPDWVQGYGYQFWRCRHDAYRGDGAFGQFCVVMPAQQAVVAITAGVRNMQQVLDLIWAHLLPAMSEMEDHQGTDGGIDGGAGKPATLPASPAPMPAESQAQAALTRRLATLRLQPPEGQRTSPAAARVSGKTFIVAENADRIETIRFDFGNDGAEGCLLTIRNDRGDQQVPCGYGGWSRGAAAVERPATWQVAASGAWADERTYVAQWWWYETPFARTLTCRFEGEQLDRLLIQQQVNVAFGGPEQSERPQLEGRAS